MLGEFSDGKPMMRAAETRVAVIGSGFGGLAAAIRLQAAGMPTTIYEARDKAGGRAYVHERGGFVFDDGPTVITAPHCLEELFAAGGADLHARVELLPVTPFYRLIWQDGTQLDMSASPEKMAEQITALCPSDLAGYRRFTAYTEQAFDVGYTGLADKAFVRFADMIRVVPQLLRLRADRSVYATVSKFVEDERLRQALSFHSLLVGGNPFSTSAVYTLIQHLERKWGMFFPRGGTGALVKALVTLFEELGGRIQLSTPVDAIVLKKSARRRRVVHEVASRQGKENFDVVVSNADIHHTYDAIYRGHREARKRAKRIAGLDWSMSLFVLYFGTNRLYRDRIAHHTVLFGRRYKGLLDDVFRGVTLPDDQSLYLHAPTVTDPSLAPPGCDAFYVLAPVPHLGRFDGDWDELAPRYADRLLEALETVLPNLRAHVVEKSWMTPHGFRDDLRAHLGSAFSCAPTSSQSAWFRPHNRDPEIPGLYLVGAGTQPGAGIPGVVNSAKATARLVLEDFS